MISLDGTIPIGVIPVLIGPLQVLLAVLPGLLAAIFMALVSLFKPRVLFQLLKLGWRLKFHLAALALCIFGIRWAVLRFRPRTIRGTAVAATGGADWSAFRGGIARTGSIGGSNEPSQGQVNWAVRKEERFYASPAVVGGRVYVATAAGLSPFDKEGVGTIRCLDADSGAELWSASPAFKSGASKYRATFSSPVVMGDFLVCGEGLHETKRCRVVCLDLTRGKEGNLLWSYETASHVECTPAIARVTWTESGREISEDRVFVGAGDNDGYYCFDLKSGAVRWHLAGKDFPDAETALVVHANRVYAGQGNGGKALCVIDAVTGKLIRRVPTPYPVFAPPAIAHGKLYIGMGNGDFVNSAATLNLPAHGELWCLDLARLEGAAPFEPDWKVAAGETLLGAIAVDGDEAWFCSADGWLHCVDVKRQGALRGKWNAHDAVKSSPAVTPRFVYVATESGMLYAIARETFEPVWTCRIGAQPLCISSPAVAHGRVYVGTEESGFVCAGEAALPGRAVWPGRAGGPEKAGNFFGSPLPERGQFAWNWPAGLDGSSPVAQVAAPVAAPNERMLVPIAAATTNGPNPGLVCLPVQSARSEGPGRILWSVVTTNGVYQSPATSGNQAFFVDGRSGDPGRGLHCLDARTGQITWRRAVSPAASGVFMVTDRVILIQDRPAALTCLDMRGRAVWTASGAGIISNAPAVSRALVAVSSASPPTLCLLDRDTGRRLWTVPLAGVPVSSPVFSRNTIQLATTVRLEARNVTDGQPPAPDVWHPNAFAVSGDLTATRGSLACITTNGALVVIDRKTGMLRAEPVPGALPGASVLPGGNAFLYLRKDGAVMRVCLDTGAANSGSAPPTLKPVEWLADTAALGKPATPMVMAGGNIFMGWTGWGLVCLGPAK